MFNRIYLGTLISVVLISLLLFGIFQPLHKQRLFDYQHQLMTPINSVIFGHFSKQSVSKQIAYLELVSQLLDAKLKIINQAQPTPAFKQTDSGKMQWLFPIAESQTALMTISELSEEQYRGITALLVAELAKQNWPLSTASIQAYSAFPVEQAEIIQLDLEASKIKRLQAGSVVIEHNEQQEGVFNLYAATKDNRVLVVGPVASFDPLPWSYVFFAIVSALVIIFIVVIVLVYLFQRRFNVLINGVDQVSTGDFEHQITLSGKDVMVKLASHINNMTQQLRTLLSNQKKLMQAVSHELRTPLAKMRFRLTLLEDDYADPAISEQVKALNGDIDQLEKLITEIISHHKYSEQTLSTFSSIGLNKLLAKQMENQQLLHPDIEFSVFSPEGVSLNGDYSAIEKLVSNLVSNAAKHCHQQVHVYIEQKLQQLVLSVEDDGVGIPVSEHQTVFEPFYRVDSSRNKQTGGYGLGLAIVKAICEQHHAQINIEKSQRLGGARFVVRFNVGNVQ